MKKLRYIFRLINFYFSRIIFIFVKPKKDRIILWSYSGKQYSCNPRIIGDYVYNNSDFEVIWAFSNLIEKDNVLANKVVQIYSIKYYYYLFSSKVIITNSRTNYRLFYKKNSQFYIQTWHSSLSLKTIEKDAERFLSERYIKSAKKDSQYMNLLLSGNQFRTNYFKQFFWYDGVILEKGIPRNDYFFKNIDLKKNNTYSNLKIDSKVGLILFAPTFRNSKFDYLNLNIKQIIEILRKKYKKDFKFLVRLHPNVSSENINVTSNVINVTNYNKLQELLLSCDFLITDYSSLMFDFLLIQKPCFLYCPDLEYYLTNERQFIFNINELPFPLAINNDELEENINNFDINDYIFKSNRFKEKINFYDNGNATKEVFNVINKVINND